jgi:predicted secreted Zn-dependent protease
MEGKVSSSPLIKNTSKRRYKAAQWNVESKVGDIPRSEEARVTIEY